MKIGGWRTRSVFEGYAIISLRLALPMLSENWKSATGIAKTKRTKALRLLGIRQRFWPREHAASCREGSRTPRVPSTAGFDFPWFWQSWHFQNQSLRMLALPVLKLMRKVYRR